MSLSLWKANMQVAAQQGVNRIVAALLLSGVLLFAAGCGGNDAEENRNGAAGGAQAAETGPVPITTDQAVVREVPAYLETTGSLIADESSNVAPEVSGQVVATPVDVGSFVSRGAILARLDDRDARLRLQQAQSAVAQAESNLQQARTRLGLSGNGRFDASSNPEVRAARAQLESAEAAARLAETNARRYASLVETGDVARAVYDQARTQAETAQAQANAARQQLATAQNQARTSNESINAAQAGVESARTQVALAQKAVNDSVITSPIAGFISDRPVAVGEYVTPASTIATVLRTNPVELQLQVPEADAGRVREGMNVSAQVSAYPDRQFGGRVVAVNPALDPTSRALDVRVELSNDGNLLRPGMFATARVIQPGGERGVFVPRNAVITNPSTSSSTVYVLDGDVARLRVVQIGDAEGDQVRIQSGLEGNETVITSNLDQLYDGASVIRR